MIQLNESIVVDRQIGDCFRYLLDFSTIEQWDPGVYRSTKRTPGAPGEGTVFDVVLSIMGRKKSMQYELKKVFPGERMVLHGDADGLRAKDTIDFRAIGAERCQIDYSAELHFDDLPGVVDPLLRPWLDGIGRGAVDGLKQALTPPAKPSEMSIPDRIKYKTVLPAAWDFTQRGYLRMEDKGLSEFIDGHTVVITGPTSGLGLATSKLLARLGARLILVGRNDEKLARAESEIQDFSGCEHNRLHLVEGDLSEMKQVLGVAETIRGITEKVDVLINNAGSLFDARRETSEGHERTLAINLLCPFVLTSALLGPLTAAKGRVINVASGGMYTQGLALDDLQSSAEPFDGPTAYARSKRALVAITDHFAESLAHRQISFNSMHPGWAETAGVRRSLPRFYRLMKSRLRDARMGADTIAWLATSAAVDGVSGQFFFDRRPRPRSLIKGTEVSSEQRQKLADLLAALTPQPAERPPTVRG